MSELSEPTKNLVLKYTAWQKSLAPKENAVNIHVDEVASRVAAFYERLRTIIDWKEEHLMRRSAIIRKLRNKFSSLELNDFSTEKIAEHLVLDLIRGGYFPNDKIDESKVPAVQKIIEKYVFILRNNPEYKQDKTGMQFYGKLLEIAACEIEETLAPYAKETALIDYMFEIMKERIKVSEKIYEKEMLKPEDKDIQIYIAVQKALFKFDEPIISYNILKYKLSYWDNPSQEEILKISQGIHKIFDDIEKDLSHPLAKKFYVICEKYDTAYLLVSDVLSNNDSEKVNKEIQNPALLEDAVKKAYQKRLTNLKAQITRIAVYSVISIFVTKILSLIILELVLIDLKVETFNILFLIADILIPTCLMALLVASVSPPSKRNLQVVVMETIKIVYQKEKQDIYEIRMNKKRGLFMRVFLTLVYLFGAFISFGLIAWVLVYFHFPPTSIFVNILFVTLVLFAGVAIKRRSEELTMENESGGFLEFLYDILFLPIMGVGGWLSNTWKQYNIIAAFFSALIDMPFSVFVEFIEGWRYFIKEKKEELR